MSQGKLLVARHHVPFLQELRADGAVHTGPTLPPGFEGSRGLASDDTGTAWVAANTIEGDRLTRLVTIDAGGARVVDVPSPVTTFERGPDGALWAKGGRSAFRVSSPGDTAYPPPGAVYSGVARDRLAWWDQRGNRICWSEKGWHDAAPQGCVPLPGGPGRGLSEEPRASGSGPSASTPPVLFTHVDDLLVDGQDRVWVITQLSTLAYIQRS